MGECELCTSLSNQCGDDYPDCCPDLMCFGDTCQDCVDNGDVCAKTSECCGTMMCFTSPGSSEYSCHLCTPEGEACSFQLAACCGSLSRYEDECQRCVLEKTFCENEEGTVPCCGTATCFAAPDSSVTCQPCTEQNQPCGEDFPIFRTAVVL